MRKTKILIVDDDERILSAIDEMLKAKGYVVRTAANGKEGLREFQSTEPDLIVTDINMPDMEGIEFIKALSKHSKSVPILAMSGDVVGKRFLKAARLFGACDTMTKPFTIPQLTTKIDALLE